VKLLLDPQLTAAAHDFPVSSKAAFLDRDGVINVDHGYVHRREEFDFYPGTLGACRLLHDAGFRLIVITNQAGIARGYYSESDFASLMSWVARIFADAGAPLDSVYYCPHHPDGALRHYRIACDCRKPRPGMIVEALARERITAAESILVGDTLGDLEAGAGSGIGRCFLVEPENPGARYRTLQDVVSHLLQP
jgi:D-glycero-D-manno-heptose 1,7-bisphosphate phosphatase